MAVGYITRTAYFSASHRLHSPRLTDQENARIYGKCNNPNGHGHNYKVEITLKGTIDSDTGMVMNMVELKKCIEASIMEPLDHRNIDKDVPFFSMEASTVENLSVFIWTNFNQFFKENYPTTAKTASLYKVKIYETEHNSAEYYGEL